jgi:hypothetical protein
MEGFKKKLRPSDVVFTLDFPQEPEKSHTLDHDTFEKLTTLKYMVADTGAKSLDVTFTTYTKMERLLVHLKRKFVGFAYNNLIDVILLANYLGVDDLCLLFNELKSRTKFDTEPLDKEFVIKVGGENKIDSPYRVLKFPSDPATRPKEGIEALPLVLVKKYLMPSESATFEKLHKMRCYSIHWWDLFTDAMITKAKKVFPKVAHLDDAILLEALHSYYWNGMSADHYEKILLQHGSLQKQKIKLEKRRIYNEKQKQKRKALAQELANKKSAYEEKIRKMIIANGYLDPNIWHKCEAYYAKNILNTWVNNLDERVDDKTVVKSMEEAVDELVKAEDFNSLFIFVGKTRFKEIVTSRL